MARKRKSNKPWITVQIDQGVIQDFEFPSYGELRKKLQYYIEESWDSKVTVTRTRRGEWGQWFEVWGIDFIKNKPVINKQGWL